jgi:hypothetical protein
MQSYALSKELQMRYPKHTVEIVDFEYLKRHNSYKKAKHSIPFGIEYSIMYSRFQKSLTMLPLSKKSFITDNTDELCDFIKSNYDIVIVGSDAVWAFQNKMPLDNPYWLFGDKLNGIIKMSYAASGFTTNFESISKEDRDFIKGRLKDFSYIGVRDNATKTFIESLNLDRQVFLNNDPTLFLEPTNDTALYKKCLHKNFVFSNKNKISFMTRKMPYIKDLRKELSSRYDLIHLYRRDNASDILSSRCRFLPNLSPFEWYNLFGQISLNITYFFHGACLSLVNHIPTIAIDDATTPYKSKYSQLMTDLGLGNYLFSHKEMNYTKLIECVEYLLSHQEQEKHRISEAIKNERKKSLSFFNKLDDILK